MYAKDMVTGADSREVQVACEVATQVLNDY
jgi:hypothetical protein